MRHGVQVGGNDAAVDVLAERQRQLRLRAEEFLRFDHFAQPDGFALVVRHLDADRRLAGHALDEDAFGAQGEAEIVGQAGDAAVLDAGFGLELEGRDHGAGIDLHDLAAHVELAALFAEHLGEVLQLEFVDGTVLVGAVQQRGGRQLEAAGQARHGRLAVLRGVGARGDGDGFSAGSSGSRLRRWSDGLARRRRVEHALDAALRWRGLRQRRRHCRRATCGASTSSTGARARFGTSCAVTTGLPLAAAARFFSRSLAAFLRARSMRQSAKRSSAAYTKPKRVCDQTLHRAERERRREIQRHRDDGQTDQIRADHVEVVNQRVGNNAAQQAFGRDHAHPVNVRRQQSDEAGEERDAARRRRGSWR